MGRYVTHFVEHHDELLVVADLASVKDPVPPLLPYAAVCEVYRKASPARHRKQRLGLLLVQVIPDGSEMEDFKILKILKYELEILEALHITVCVTG